jgi:thiol:disulfide interchange protein DsbD
MKKLKKTYLNALIIIIFSLFSSISLLTSSPLDQLTQDEILPADEAFKLSVNKHSENRIILRWDMKENCFLYKDKFNIYSETGNIGSIKITGSPNQINDIYFGEVVVYFNSVSQEIN